MRQDQSILNVVAAIGLALLPSFALPGAEVPDDAAERYNWPQFRGPGRDGISRETGLSPSWPDGGPPRLWETHGLGQGYSSPIVVDGAVYITGDIGETLVVFALNGDGTERWRTTNGRAWRASWAGSRASCTYHRKRLYHMNGHGRVACFDPADGRELWAVDLQKRFGALPIQWGFSECLLADGPRLYVSPGGPECLMAALDVETGATVWKGEPLRFRRTREFGGKAVNPPRPDTDRAGYASPILVERDGRRLLFGASARHLICVDPENGRILWREPVPARYEVIGTIPVRWGNCVFFAAPDDYGGALFRVHTEADGIRMEKLWEVSVDNCHGGLVVMNNQLFGAGYRRYRGWACIDLKSGGIRYALKDLAKGSIVAADNRLFALSERGVMALLEPGPDGFVKRGSFRLVPPGPKDVWAHPVICNRRLYLRCHDVLSCYDIRARR